MFDGSGNKKLELLIVYSYCLIAELVLHFLSLQKSCGDRETGGGVRHGGGELVDLVGGMRVTVYTSKDPNSPTFFFHIQ